MYLTFPLSGCTRLINQNNTVLYRPELAQESGCTRPLDQYSTATVLYLRIGEAVPSELPVQLVQSCTCGLVSLYLYERPVQHSTALYLPIDEAVPVWTAGTAVAPFSAEILRLASTYGKCCEDYQRQPHPISVKHFSFLSAGCKICDLVIKMDWIMKWIIFFKGLYNIKYELSVY